MIISHNFHSVSRTRLLNFKSRLIACNLKYVHNIAEEIKKVTFSALNPAQNRRDAGGVTRM